MSGWQRVLDFGETGLPWVMPSPNMPTIETAFVYPGGCLLEGTELSEGRGTTRPFEVLGAPYIEPGALVEALAEAAVAKELSGVIFRPLFFQPTFHKFSGETCGGVQVHVTDRSLFRPVATYTALIAAVAGLWPDQFAWKKPPYEYETEKLPIDILAGGQSWRRGIESGAAIGEMSTVWEKQLAEFEDTIAEYRIYA